MPTPAELGFAMPAEWSPHERTWMAWPTEGYTLGEDPTDAVPRVVAGREHDRALRAADDGRGPGARASRRRVARPGRDQGRRPLNDAWMRDIGPTFLTKRGELAAADWIFNGWGAQSWAQWDKDAEIAESVIGLAGASRFVSRLVNEGGGIHVDGEGTVLITETVQLDQGRNPEWTKQEVEEELQAFLGVRKVIWLPRGLTRDYGEFGTRGHVDIVAAFVRPGVVVVHTQPDPAHPDHEVGKETSPCCARPPTPAAVRLEVVELPAPTVLTEADGEPVDYSYINHYLGNGFALLCGFDDPRDRQAAEILGTLLPGRKIEFVDARPIFERGGGIHCITQQQPAV